MKDSIMLENEDKKVEEFIGGKDFVEAVAKATSKEELKRILNDGGVTEFSDEQLEESYKSLALSQDWDSIQEMFQDKDFGSCSRKLEAHGITTTKDEFDLINEVIATASDDELIKEILHETDMDRTLAALHDRGYHAITADFLLLVQENALHLYEDALLTQEEIKEFSGKNFYERCQKSINLIFALSSIAGLALGISGVADPALLIAIAGGVSLMFGRDF